MQVATLLTIAASFWASHGYQEAQPVTWDWGSSDYAYEHDGIQAQAVFGSYHFSMSREWWDHATKRERCVVVVHEVGHAAFSFPHRAGTVMAQYADDQRVPGACKPRRWGSASAPSRLTPDASPR